MRDAQDTHDRVALWIPVGSVRLSLYPGSYTPSGCSQSSCCCMTSVSISGSSSTYTVSGPLSGQCGSESSVSVNFAPPTSNSITYSAFGNSHSATRSASNGNIADINNSNSACTAVLIKNAAAAATPVIGVMAAMIAALIAGAKIIN
jgi:hypothetical protein